MSISLQDFGFIREMLKEQSAISLSADKEYMVESRLLPVARENGLIDIAMLINEIRTKKSPDLITQVVEAMTTNETSFFRDKKPFDNLKDILKSDILPNHTEPKIRIWCAACSSGQEPYSITMMFLEEPGILNGKDFEIIATDIDNKILDKARSGKYTQFDIQRGLPIQYLMKYFGQDEDNKNSWVLKDIIKSRVKFNQLNLLDSFALMGKFDVIMCRNVLFYFDVEDKKDILDRIALQMNKNSVLFLGNSESTTHTTDVFENFSSDYINLFKVKGS